MRARSLVIALFALVILTSVIFSASALSSGTGRIVYAMNCLCSQLRSLMPPISMLLVVLAAITYGAGRVFGSEMGQKASAMAAFMIVAAILSVTLAVAGPDIMRMLYNDPGMAIACEASACANEQPAPAAPAPAAVSSSLRCGSVLNISNRNYVLDGDISSIEGGSCIEIDADNISLDCRGFWISARSRADGAGQHGISTNSTNTTIRNCQIRDYGYGILLAAAKNTTLVNNTVQSTISGGRGIFIGADRRGRGSSLGARVENNTITGQSAAIYMEYSASCVITTNTLSSEENSLTLLSSARNLIRFNNVSAQGGAAAILSAGSNQNIIFSNSFNSGADAVHVVDSYLNLLDSNNLSASSSSIALSLSSEPGVSAENTIARNYFMSGRSYIVNDGTSNYFNTTKNGRAIGNHYAGIDISKLTDRDSDGYADGGSAYPYNKKNSAGKWLGSGEDFGPKMER